VYVILAAHYRCINSPGSERPFRQSITIGWHSFRHSLATNLRALGVDIKVAQELMRHSSCCTTLDVDTRAVDQQKREASLKVVGWMLPMDLQKFQHPSAPSDTQKGTRRCR
jgi:hypothetical protein